MLARGQIMEQGTHDELYALQGIYHRLVEAQSLSHEAGAFLEIEKVDEISTSPKSSMFTRTESDPTRDYEALAKSGVLEKKQYTSVYLLKRVSLLSCTAEPGISIQ